MLVKEAGRATLVKDLQPSKARYPMLVKEAGNVKLLKELQRKNALSPMFVKEVGNVKLRKRKQVINALFPMLVTVSGMTTFPLFDIGHHITFLRSAVYKISSLITKCFVLSK